MTPSQIIASLNSMNVGELDAVRGKLAEARQACAELDQEVLVVLLEQAGDALGRSDLKTYRKRVETAIAQLGHLR